MGSSCSTPSQPVPTTAAEAEATFGCTAKACRLSGLACARRYRRAEVRPRWDEVCAVCPAGKARAELLGIEPPVRAEKSIPLPESPRVEATPVERHCEACGVQLDPRRMANARNPLDPFCGDCVEVAAAPVRGRVLGAPKWLIAEVVRGERPAGSAVREALRLGCLEVPAVREA